MTDDFLPRDLLGKVDLPTVIELEAQRLVAARSPGDEPVLGMLEREMDANLAHIEELRALHKDLDRDLLRSECRIRTELHRLKAPQYDTDDQGPQRLTLKRRLEELARERRSVSIDLVAQRRSLLDRLAILVERHRQLRGVTEGAGRGNGNGL